MTRLNELKYQQRALLVGQVKRMHKDEGLTMQQIAELLNKPDTLIKEAMDVIEIATKNKEKI